MARSRILLKAFLLLSACAVACGFLQAQVASGTFGETGPPAPYRRGPGMPLGDRVAALLADPRVAGAHWGIAVTSLGGTPIYGLDESKLFRPASTTKLFTTAAAMALLGPEATIITTVTSPGSLDTEGTLHGDVYLHGAGDANLSNREFPYENPAVRQTRLAADKAQAKAELRPDPLQPMRELAAQMAAAGVKRVDGDVIAEDRVWPREPYGEGWSGDDQPWGYGAPVSALTFNDNAFELTVTPGSKLEAPATLSISPDVGQFAPGQIGNSVLTLPQGPMEVTVEPAGLLTGRLHVEGAVSPEHPDHETLAAIQPDEFAAQAFRKALQEKGIEVRGLRSLSRSAHDPRPFALQSGEPLRSLAQKPDAEVCSPVFDCYRGLEGQMLASRTSVPLVQDVTFTLKTSQNLHAEMLLRRLGKAFANDGSFAQGARVVRQWSRNAGLRDGDFFFTMVPG